ncbi:MAG: PEGA domain-containing protein [Labilithrix sp.]|nr:PEGA domain-containing protein [Labilithrix sp.]
MGPFVGLIGRSGMLGQRGSSNVRRLTVMLVFSSLAATSVPAWAAGDEFDERRMQAQALYDQGVKLETSDPKAALGALRSSYEIHSNFRVLYNIARVCARLGDKDCATRSFEQYLKDGGAEIPTKRRKEVEAELKALTPRSKTTIMVTSSVRGAFVKIDGSVVGQTPLPAPVPVSAGKHKVVLVADGNVIEKTVHVAAGSSENVVLEAKKEETPAPAPAPVPAPAPAPAPEQIGRASGRERARARVTCRNGGGPPPPARPSDERGGVPVVPWIVAGALATATGVSAVLTASASSDYQALAGRYPVTRDELDAAHGKGRDLLLLTTVLGAVTVVSVGVAGYFTFFRGSAPPREKTVGLAVGPTGVTITGRLP